MFGLWVGVVRPRVVDVRPRVADVRPRVAHVWLRVAVSRVLGSAVWLDICRGWWSKEVCTCLIFTRFSVELGCLLRINLFRCLQLCHRRSLPPVRGSVEVLSP